MTWFGYVLVLLVALWALVAIDLIGKPRGPISQDVAIGRVLIAGLLILGCALVGV